jgi:hypothetical protein
MAENIDAKKEIDRLLEVRKNEPEEEIKKPLKQKIENTTEVERLQLENLVLKKQLLEMQVQEVDRGFEDVIQNIKKRLDYGEDYQVSVNLNDVTKCILNPKD